MREVDQLDAEGGEILRAEVREILGAPADRAVFEPLVHNLKNGVTGGVWRVTVGDRSGEAVFSRNRVLDSLRALADCPDLRSLSLISCPLAQDVPAAGIETLRLSGLDWKDLSRLAGHKSLRELDIRGLSELRDLGALTGLSELTEINLGHCRDLEDCRPLLDMPSLKHVTMPYRMWYSEYHGDPDPVMTELAQRGVTVVHP
ncbi:hypothetical protein [Streptomyces sp. NPDC058086]|uniref:hypothetical protein n=1 Tax=Streptomyces sp. NPDC058086 TaxID=3346334 RepID=UPI0036ECF458